MRKHVQKSPGKGGGAITAPCGQDTAPHGSKQSCKMSILLHGAKFLNQILPQEKCVIRNDFGVFCEFI